MKIEILHQLTPTFNETSVGPLKRVATLIIDELPLDDILEMAFHETNSIGEPWFADPLSCLAPEPGRHRSTSVGDVVVVDDSKAFQCASAGWVERDIGLVRVMRMPG